MLRQLNVLLVVGIISSALVLTVSAQSSEPFRYPGDPISEDDKIFVDLDGGEDATCGVTAANNIRCWGATRIAPMWTGGIVEVGSGNATQSSEISVPSAIVASTNLWCG